MLSRPSLTIFIIFRKTNYTKNTCFGKIEEGQVCIAPIYMHYFQLVSKRLNFLPSIDYIEPHLQLNHSEIALSLPVLAGLSFI